MKRICLLALLSAAVVLGVAYLASVQVSAAPAWEDRPAMVPLGIAIGPSLTVEVSFASMTNNQGCEFNGAYVLDSGQDTATREAMLAVLRSAKDTERPVRVRLHGCTDRPKITHVFLDATWL